jgi:hypothetical protein
MDLELLAAYSGRTTRGKIMDKKLVEYFQMKLLQNPKRIRQSDDSIKEFYNQPERSKREDMGKCNKCDSHLKEDSFDVYCPTCLKKTYDAVL